MSVREASTTSAPAASDLWTSTAIARDWSPLSRPVAIQATAPDGSSSMSSTLTIGATAVSAGCMRTTLPSPQVTHEYLRGGAGRPAAREQRVSGEAPGEPRADDLERVEAVLHPEPKAPLAPVHTAPDGVVIVASAREQRDVELGRIEEAIGRATAATAACGSCAAAPSQPGSRDPLTGAITLNFAGVFCY